MFKTTALDSVGNAFVDKNPGTSTPGTRIVADDQNIKQDELVNVVEQNGVALDPSGTLRNQVYTATSWIYTTLKDYVANLSYAIGSDGILYHCLINNGPSSSVVDPVGDLTGTWVSTVQPSEISDEAYGGSWNGVTDEGASKNALYDKIDAMDTDRALKAVDTTVVHKAGTETITGDKNFTGSLQKSGLNVVNAGSNLGAGADVFKDISANTMRHRSLVGGTNIDTVEGTDTITFNSSAPAGGNIEETLVAGPATSSSATYELMPEVSVSITTSGNPILIIMSCGQVQTVNQGTIAFDVSTDALNPISNIGTILADTAGPATIIDSYVVGAGTHIFRGIFKTTGVVNVQEVKIIAMET